MRILIPLLLAATAAFPASAQWEDVPDQKDPLNADGELDVGAPIARLPNGKPDLSGTWMVADIQLHGWNMGKALEGGDPPYQPWTAKLVERRKARNLIDTPSSRCYPVGVVGLEGISPFNISVLDDRIIMLFEETTTFRQIFLDGRKLPQEPDPTYNGYSVGHWEGDTLVVETNGFNGTAWLDLAGNPATEQLRLTEKFRRNTFGALEIEMTFDDPLAYTKPWTVTVPFKYLPGYDVSESFCTDNKFDEQLDDAHLLPMDVVPQEPSLVEDETPEGIAADKESIRLSAELARQLQGLELVPLPAGMKVVFGDAMFGGGDALTPEGETAVDRIASMLKENGNLRAYVAGHAQNSGSDAGLAETLAQTVRKGLIDRGVTSWQSIAYGLGAKYPIAGEEAGAGRKRRVEIVLTN